MTPEMHRKPFVERYVGALTRHDSAIVFLAFVLFVVSALTATRLKLRSDFTELLPQDDPELTHLRTIGDRMGAPSTLIVAVESDDRAANERFAEALAQNLRPLIGSDLASIDYRPHAADPFFERNKALYADLDDLRRLDDDLRKLLASRKNPAFIPFADADLHEQDDDPKSDLRLLRTDLEKRRAAAQRFPSGYYESEDGKLLAIVTWTRSSGTGDLSGFRIRDDVQRVVDETRPSTYGPLTVRLTGDVASAIEEHDALKSDIEWVSLVCTVLVLLVISLYYRSVFALSYVFFPTLLGVAVAFAITALTIGYLNTNTAFLGSIILGNGINFGIIFLARYREERLKHPRDLVELALGRAVAATAKPTLAAALAAAIAYGSLALTNFRGFRQFGEVGGVGMILCWAATYSYCPALVHFIERRFRRRPKGRGYSSGSLERLSAILLRSWRPLLVVLGVATAFSAWSLAPVLRSPFEYDFSKLRNQRSRKQGAGDLYVRVGRIFPQDLAPVGIAMLPRWTDAPSYRRALLVKDCVDGLTRSGDKQASDPRALSAECVRRVGAGEPTGGLLSAVATIYDFLPRDQDGKLDLLAGIRAKLKDSALETLSADERADIDKWMPPASLQALTPADLPDEISRRFREVDGTVGRVALIFPVRVWANWDGHSLIRLSEILNNVHLPSGEVVSAAGHSTLFAAMLRSIAHDGPIASAAAAIGVVLAVILLFRRRRPVILVLSSLLLGVIWMGGAGAAIGLKLNFLNFVALPVTLGIGVDYAVNVFARLVQEPVENQATGLAETGSAVALCSSTTIIGYSSLLIASNGALRSFGKLADLGEIGCLLAALLVVPLVTRSRRNRASAGT
jgi:predicted RND superfamily exporter protein